jgi:hypothetical protein
VHPSDLRFTQDNIRVTFQAPFDSTRIDDAVDMIISGEWTASTCACICVVEVDGVLFSLDNRRLWVFRKAALRSITVKLKKAKFNHPRLQFMSNPGTLKTMKSESFFPRVRGKVRQTEWSIPAALNVERNILVSSAKEHQLPPPVHKVSEVHHLCGVSRIPVDGASGEKGTCADTIDIGTENCKDSAQNAVMEGLLKLMESKALKLIVDFHCHEQGTPLQYQPVQNDTTVSPELEQGDVHMISADLRCHEQGPPLQHQHIRNDTTVSADLEQGDVQMISADRRCHEQGPPLQHQPVQNDTTVSADLEQGDVHMISAHLRCHEQGPPLQHQPVQNDTTISADLEQGDVHMISADLRCHEQGPPLQHQHVRNDTTVSADLEQGDVQMIFTDSMPFLSSSQQWWKSYFGLMIDRAWSYVKGAVQTIWNYFKSKFPRW